MKTKQHDVTLKMNFNRRPSRWRPGLPGGLGTALLLLLFLPLVLQAQIVVWQDNFENGDTVWDNWSVDNGVWEIGVPLTGPPTNSAGWRAHQGTNCAATVLNGNYPASRSSRLIRTLPFLVPLASQNPRLQFWHWYAFSGSSYGVVQIKYGTNAWTDLSPRYYTTGSGVWTRPVVDLKAYAGKAVQVAFQIAADGNVADGWDVDEVRVVKGDYVVGFTNNAAEGFELGLGDWYAETGTWEVGVPTYGPPTNAVGQRAHSETNCAATVLAGDYPEDRSSRLVSPPFVVPTEPNPRLRFWHWWSIGAHDWAQVQIRVGTNAWQGLSGQYSADSSGRWSRGWLDLSAYAGQTVQLAFYLESHSVYDVFGYYRSSVGPGWYVDEVMVETGPPPPPNFPEGFEYGWGGWRAEYFGGQATDFAVWEVGVPASGPPTNAAGRRAFAGTNCAATVLNGNYPASRASRLVSPALAVPNSDQIPRLEFWHWYQFSGGSYGVVEIKVGTNAWAEVTPRYFADSIVWTRLVVDLSPYAGQTIQVGLRFASDGNVAPGWYVDELQIVTGAYRTLTNNVAEGFERGIGDWYAETGIWEVGVPTSGPPTNSAGWRAHEGTNCAATVLAGSYTEDRSSRLVSPPFLVPDIGEHPKLRFWHWFSIGAHDFCQVQIRVGADAWENLSPQYTGNGGVWSRLSFDLSAYAGQTVQLAFYLESHSAYDVFGYYRSSVGPGWYVDEVVITSVTPPTGIVEFTDARYFAYEGGTNATITVERKYGSAGAADVTFVATDGTAVGDLDFTSVVDTLSWADGEQGVKTISVPITQDTLIEGNETVTLQLVVPGALASSVAREDATLVIIDDDGPPLSTNIAYLRSLVGTTNWVPTNTTSLFTVEGTVTTYTNLSSTPADELFFMQDGTNGIAVLFRGGTNQFMPQAGDRLRVTATLTNISGLLALAPNYANITNVVWRLSSGNALPGPAALDFADKSSVTKMEATEARYLSVSQVWISQSGGGYFPTALTNVLVTNSAGQTFDLTINPNTDIAGKLKPTGPVAILGVLSQNDPTAPYTTNYSLLPTRYADIVGGNPGVVQFVATNYGVWEPGAPVALSVSRTVSSSGPVSVSFATVNGTAVAGSDFVGTNGVLSWADGESGNKTIDVSPINDAVEEPDELLYVSISGAVVGSNNTAQITIVNDDFVARPAAQTTVQGSSATLSITPTPSTTACQWWKDGVLKTNATDASLILPNAQTTDAGSYWAVVTTSLGTATSSVATLSVLVPPSVTGLTVQPASPVLEGTNVTFCVSATGTAPLSFQWRWNGTDIPGANGLCYTLANPQTWQSGRYGVLVSNLAGTVFAESPLAVQPNWRTNNIGGTGEGSFTMEGGVFTVRGSGEDIEGTEDRFFFVHKPLVGDGQIVARLIGLLEVDPKSEAGMMLRDGTNSGARHVLLALNASKETKFRRRHVENDYSVENKYYGTNSAWLRLMRMGDTFVGHYSTNGLNWEMVWWTTIANMPTNLEAGLAVTAHKNQAFTTATFDMVETGLLTPLSGAWPEAGPRIWLGGEPYAYPPLSQLGGMKMLIGGSVGGVFMVKASPDINTNTPFAMWSPLGTVTNTYGVVDFLDTRPLTNQHQFYGLQRVGP